MGTIFSCGLIHILHTGEYGGAGLYRRLAQIILHCAFMCLLMHCICIRCVSGTIFFSDVKKPPAGFSWTNHSHLLWSTFPTCFTFQQLHWDFTQLLSVDGLMSQTETFIASGCTVNMWIWFPVASKRNGVFKSWHYGSQSVELGKLPVGGWRRKEGDRWLFPAYWLYHPPHSFLLEVHFPGYKSRNHINTNSIPL